MNSWQEMVGLFESSRAEAPLTLVLFIIFVVYYILTCVNWFSWQAIVLVTVMTWVRAPGLQYSHIVFP